MEYRLFLDSDVVIDFFTDREPLANPASELFELNEQGIVKLFCLLLVLVLFTI